ncbi:MAG: hypothetical protein K1Y36_10810 [Blastocatellia bacterium]|nr:hypothetical protein [Blastocatellia bacterium]
MPLFPAFKPVNEAALPWWRDLPAGVRLQLERANLNAIVFDEFLGRRRGDVLNFYAALSSHDLWKFLLIEHPNQEMGYNGLQFNPQPTPTRLFETLCGNRGFSNLNRTWRGYINRWFHPETFNFSENRPATASLHFTFNETGPASVHFDFYNAHTPAVFPILGHTLLEYPTKFWREFSNAGDIHQCLNCRFARDVWREFPEK